MPVYFNPVRRRATQIAARNSEPFELFSASPLEMAPAVGSASQKIPESEFH